MKIKILKQLQEYYYDLKDDNGIWREKPIGILAKASTPKNNIEKIKTILSILESSDKLDMCTKIFMCNKKLSIKAANDILNDLRDQASEKLDKQLRHVSYTTSCIRMTNDEEKLTLCIGDTFLKRLVYNIDITSREIEDKVSKLIKEFSVFDNQRKNLTLYINDSYFKCGEYKGNEKFFEKLKDIECYLIQRKEIIENAINSDKEFVGYFNYLLSSKGIQDNQVMIDRERLLKFLNNQDYFTGYNEDTHGDSKESVITDRIVEQYTEDISTDTMNSLGKLIEEQDVTTEQIEVSSENKGLLDDMLEDDSDSSDTTVADNVDTVDSKQEIINRFKITDNKEDTTDWDEEVII